MLKFGGKIDVISFQLNTLLQKHHCGERCIISIYQTLFLKNLKNCPKAAPKSLNASIPLYFVYVNKNIVLTVAYLYQKAWTATYYLITRDSKEEAPIRYTRDSSNLRQNTR